MGAAITFLIARQTNTTLKGKGCKMMYRVSWKHGRKRGAIGVFYPDSVVVEAENKEAALLKAYDTHEWLMFTQVEKITDP